MKFLVACLLVCVSAAQAQYFGYGGYYGGYYPYSGIYGYPGYNGVALKTAAYPTAAVAAYGAYPYYAGYAPSYTSSQYHAQDELGQASFGYAHPGQAAVNYRDAFGNQVGSYAYINPEGKEVRVSYTADSRGFRVLSNDLPVGPSADLVAPEPVQDTAEVAEAKAAHMAAVAAAKAGILPEMPVAPAAPAAELPMPVEDTAEVAMAKKEHAEAWAAAKAAADAAPERKKRSVFAYSAPFATPYAGHFGYPYAAATPLAYSYATPYTYAAAPAVASVPVREATLTKTILTPGHAVAYRVD